VVVGMIQVGSPDMNGGSSCNGPDVGRSSTSGFWLANTVGTVAEGLRDCRRDRLYLILLIVLHSLPCRILMVLGAQDAIRHR
jgi:hypothetical protein